MMLVTYPDGCGGKQLSTDCHVNYIVCMPLPAPFSRCITTAGTTSHSSFQPLKSETGFGAPLMQPSAHDALLVLNASSDTLKENAVVTKVQVKDCYYRVSRLTLLYQLEASRCEISYVFLVSN